MHEDSRLYLIVRLQALWAEFCKQIVVLSAVGGLLTLEGNIVAPAPGIKAFSDTKRVTDPLERASWHRPKTPIRAAKKLKVENYDQLSLGLSSVNVNNMFTIRNFIVHPTENTRRGYVQATRDLGLPGAEPESVPISLQKGGATLFEEWVADLQTAATNAIR